jgi:succinate dehydrogenase / fumarate reductase flavoprotein subunit
MEKYDPKKMELSSRDVVARSIYTEVQEGRGSEHGGAYLDITHRGAEYIKKKLPSMYEQFLKLADIDITKEPMEVAPTIHYAMGGVRVEPETVATNVPGLFAAGEVAAGLHGANRLGGNSLSDLLVFGRRAGAGAAQYCNTLKTWGKIDEAQIEDEKKSLLRPFNDAGTENPYQIHEELQDAMQEGAGIARTAESLEKALKKILELQGRAKNTRVPGSRLYNPGWHTARDILFMLTVSEAIVRCAIERKESRGAQWRKDFLNKDEAWGKQNLITFKHASGTMKLKTVPALSMPAELAELFKQEPVAPAKK